MLSRVHHHYQAQYQGRLQLIRGRPGSCDQRGVHRQLSVLLGGPGTPQHLRSDNAGRRLFHDVLVRGVESDFHSEIMEAIQEISNQVRGDKRREEAHQSSNQKNQQQLHHIHNCDRSVLRHSCAVLYGERPAIE